MINIQRAYWGAAHAIRATEHPTPEQVAYRVTLIALANWYAPSADSMRVSKVAWRNSVLQLE